MGLAQVEPNTRARYVALDGLRGIAATVVILFHFLACFNPQLVPEYSTNLPRWVDTPIGLAFHGSFAVSIFFVLSGFVLASASSRSTLPLWFSVASRWMRLAIPATVSILLAWMLLQFIPDALLVLDSHLPSRWHQFAYQVSIPSVWQAFAEGLFWIFVQTPGPGAFNNVLWTMKFEFLGSVGVYIFYRACPVGMRLPALAAVIAAIVATGIPMPYFAFALGALLFELSNRKAAVSGKWAWCSLMLGLLLAFPAAGFVGRWRGGSLPYALHPGEPGALIGSLAAFLIVYAILNSAQIARPFEARLPKFLGLVSFPAYLLHVPIMQTLTAWTVVRFELFGVCSSLQFSQQPCCSSSPWLGCSKGSSTCPFSDRFRE